MACYLSDGVVATARASVEPASGSSAQSAVDFAVAPEDAQDAVSCLYLLLQHYGPALAAEDNPAGQTALAGIGDAMLLVLKVSAVGDSRPSRLRAV